ncbi:MAG: hypothetical protein QG604_3 [Candidatus Dependentiae bacterium]|nr:hypothetical protein [Candidatus Dependentiae bacterium]
MIADIFNPLSHGSKDDIFAKIAEHRKAFLSDLTALEVKKNTTVVEQTGIKKQLRDRDDALKKIQAENAQRLAAMRQKFPFTAEDIKSMGTIDFLTPDETASIVDEKDPVSYTVNNMKNTFRWIEKWKLPEADSGSVIFDVAGDREIHIAFHHEVHEKEQVHNKDFDILLGTKQNSINVIRDQNNVVLFSSGDPNGLVLQKKDGGFQTYWASFNKGYVSVGRGATPGKELLFDWNVPNLPEKIQYFSFSSQDNQLAFVNIHTGPPSTQAFGSQYSSYNAYNQFSWPLKLPALNNGTITFTAKASQHIAIGLSDNPHATFARYLAAIGAEGNSKATMATSAPDGKTYNYLAISQDPDATLSDSSNKTYHPYWATFNNGHFVIGSGTNPSKNIISEMYADPATMAPSVIVNILAEAPPSSTAPAHSAAPAEHHDTPATPIDPAKKPTEGGGGCPIQYVSFSSWDNPVEIRDIVIQPAVACPIGTMASAVNRHFACTWNETWALPTAGKGIVTWHGKGASDMCLALHTNGTSTDNSYTLLCTIGAEKNTKTTLSDHTKKVISETTDTEAIIAAKSSYTPYWFAYDEDGYCMLGTGTTPGNDVILETPTDKQPLTHFCFTNNTDHVEFNSIAALPLDKPLRRGTQFTAGPQTPLTWRSSWTLPNTDDLLLIFAAKTQFGFSVGLQTDAKEIYTLVVGDAGGTKTTVADDKGAILVTTENKATYITDPFNFYPYWVHYNKATGALAYGHGPVTQKDIIGQTTLPAKPAFTSFAIGNQTQASLYCKKIAALDPKDPIIVTEYGDALLAEAYTTHTPQPTATYVWEEAWKLHKPDAGIMTLNARSSGTLCIGIGNQKSGAVYEVFINGKEATVRKNKTVVARSTDSDALLPDGDNFYGFWISYHKGHLTVGRNSDPHKNTVLEWLDREPAKEITHFALASANGDATYQDTTQLPGNAMPAYQTYSACQEKGVFNWLSPWALAKPEQGLITFEVKTDSEAVIGLTGTKAEPTYVIKIGKNCTITQNGVLVATSELGSQPLVSKEDFQAFWIVFDKGYIAVGQGTTQNNDSLLADYQNINVVDIMQRFSVSSSTGQATYRTIESQRSSTSVLKRNTSFSANMRKGTYTFSDKWKLSANSAGSIVFDVQGDGPYYFGLDNKLATLANPLFEVIIGANKNTGAQIKKQGNIVESITDARGVVSVPSHASTYWVIFNEDHISVGAGNKPGVKTFLDWKDSMSSEATYFSFSSDASNVRYSNIQNLPVAKQEKVDQYVIPANRGKYKFDQTWRLLQSDFGGIVLKARGANDLCIGLHNSTGGTPLYEVVIGADKNSRTVIKSNGSVVAAIDSANAVIKNQYVPAFYWVLYDHGSVCVGLGDKPGTNILLFWHDDTIEADRGIIYYALAANDQMITVEQMASVKGISWPVNSIYNSYNKQGVFTWNPHWKLKMGQTLTCDVTASNGEVYIGLNNIPSMMPRYAVILGGWKNTKSVIMDKDTVAGKFDVTVKPITKSLWITYQNNTISVGTGDPHSKELFSWNNPKPDSPDTVAYFALSSGSTNVLYENITVIDAQAITSPKANKKVAGIQIATAPKEEPPVTDPSDPRYLPPTIAALMKATPEEAVATTASTGVAVPSTTAAAPAAEAKRPVPESSADFLKSLNPGDFVTVATPSSTIKTAPPTANDAPLSDDQQVVADVTAIFSDDAPSSNTPADTPKSPQAAIAA